VSPRRDFLVRGEQEPEGYGLYSYILLRDMPTSQDDVARIDSIIDEWRTLLDKSEPLGELDNGQINRFVIPITHHLQEGASTADILTAYDLRLARSIWTKVGLGDQSLVLLCLQRPAEVSLEDPKPRLRVDLSAIPASAAHLYFREFLAKARDGSLRNPSAARRMAWTLRAVVAQLAADLGGVQAAAKDWVALIQ